jgi:hypothetical protein
VDSPITIDWAFSGSNGIVHITGSVALTEEFIDGAPRVSVPEGSALRTFLDRARGSSALTHRQSFDLRLNAPR